MAFRLKLPNSGTAGVSPTIQSYTHTTSNRIRLTHSDTSALTTNLLAPDSDTDFVAGDTAFTQFVSDPMLSGITFTNGDAINLAVQCLEANAGNNLFVQLFVSIVSRDGSTVQRTIRSKVVDGLEVATSLTNRNLTTTQSGTTYTTVAGDRLVVELSLQGTPVNSGGTQGHNGSMRFGGSGTADLGSNDTDTSTTLNPWIEFVPNIAFESDPFFNGERYASDLSMGQMAKKSIGVAALTIGLGLLQSTLAPAEAEVVPQFYESVTWLQGKRPAPPWEPPNPLVSTLSLAPPAADGTPTTQSTTLLYGPRRFVPFDPPNSLLSTLAPPAAAAPFDQTEWPNPRAAARLRSLDSWTSTDLNTTLLPTTAAPFKPIEWANPLAKSAVVDLKTWTQNRPSYYVEPTTQPFTPGDWPNPRGKAIGLEQLRTWIQNRPSYYVEPLPFSLEDWPNPRPVPAGVSTLRTWLQNRPTYYTEPGTLPPGQHDGWPLPRRAGALFIEIVTKPPSDDVVANTPLVPADWPLPRTRAELSTLRTWLQNRPFFYVEPFPFSQDDWPNPRPLPAGTITNRTWTQNRPTYYLEPGALPIGQDAGWPLPIGKVFPISLRTWLDQRRTYFVEPFPFSQTDWPNPLPIKAVIDLRSAANNLEYLLNAPPVILPNNQYDWPNPQAKVYPIALRTWPKERPFNYVEPVPFSQADWPLATGKVPHRELRTWVQNLLQSTFGIAPPFTQDDWPLPIGKAYPHTLRTWVDWRELVLRDAIPPGRLQDWPNPLAKPNYSQLRFFENTLIALPTGVIHFPTADIVVLASSDDTVVLAVGDDMVLIVSADDERGNLP